MTPTLVLIGRPNVGKSTLFNALTKTRDALVADFAGVTRDRQYGKGVIGEKPFWVVDTGGLGMKDDSEMSDKIEAQVEEALKEADRIIFLVDAKNGLTATDENLAKKLRKKFAKKVVLVVNKVDDPNQAATLMSDFHRLGLGLPHPLSAAHQRGVSDLVHTVLSEFPAEREAFVPDPKRLAVAVIGRPNVGKSTLINRMLGEDRVIVLDRPGTTRDSVHIPFEKNGEKYVLIDTAGLRRRARVKETIEKFSAIKTLEAIDQAQVVIVVIDASEGLTDQDLHLMGLVIHLGRAMVIAINKWDGLTEYQKESVKKNMDRKLDFVNYVRRYFISALHGTGVGDLYRAIQEANKALNADIPTSSLTETLEKALLTHQPPMVSGRRVKPRFAHIGGHNPLRVVIHGKQVEALPGSYKRFLMNYFREAYHLVGIPLLIIFQNDENPFAPTAEKP